jgi:hypothetical protein
MDAETTWNDAVGNQWYTLLDSLQRHVHGVVWDFAGKVWNKENDI